MLGDLFDVLERHGFVLDVDQMDDIYGRGLYYNQNLKIGIWSSALLPMRNEAPEILEQWIRDKVAEARVN